MEIEQTKEEAVVVENLSDRLVKDFGEFDPTLELSNYKFPTIELLKDYTAGRSISGAPLNKQISSAAGSFGPNPTIKFRILPELIMLHNRSLGDLEILSQLIRLNLA